MKKSLFAMGAVLAMIAIFIVHPIKSTAADYYDYYGDNLPEGAEFAYEFCTYRVLKPATIHSYGEVEITGFNPTPDEELTDTYPYPFETVDVIGDIDDFWDFHVVGIADNAFKNNQYIKQVNITNVDKFRYIGKSAFEGCTQLRSFNYYFASGLTKIKARAFYGCSELSEVMFDKSELERVGKKAFAKTKPKLKLRAYDISPKQLEKTKKLLTKAGAKKVCFKKRKKYWSDKK
ncbi:leucine-rich repeat protein [Butyrivibrio sp. NC2002]|uniref:leucine-rich repeat protein n=1 Tax=Butyrivibrio sp. NC2002 TaxID=1410610 RepID=UPI00055D402D|nr:leucine-rich repeat domain-containing protein [Butyrivibrio sp. NC2002]